MNRKNRFGNNREEQLIEFEMFEGLYRSLKSYDNSPSVAREVFRGCNTPKELEMRFRTSLEDACESEHYHNIGTAYNYVIIKRLFEEGEDGDAREILEYLSREELCLKALNVALENLGTSYAELCLENRKLLIPRKLDKRVFERFCPESVDLIQVYLDKEGVCVISPRGSGEYIARLSRMKLSGRSVLDDKKGIVFSSLFGEGSESGITFSGKRDEVKNAVKHTFREINVNNYVIVESLTINVFGYVFLRNQINRIGGAVNQITPIRFQFKPKIVENIDEE